MGLEIQVGTPPVDGRYVVWSPCKARQIREWCEPSIATWHDGRWHFYEPVAGWIGPLPVVTQNDCLKKAACPHERTMTATTGDGLEVIRCSDCSEILHMDPVPYPTDEAYDL